ncbi:MAG: sigma-54-dependent Fis family transcriptional regulator [Gemmatimonadales bacterium]|nr:sigma-54-dependent Fis family transcriptional regulator [Gemmatimonadales bacterium]
MRVLIVGEDPGLRESLRLLLQETGYEVAEEADADRALLRAQSEEPNIILCDLRPPAMDGVAFLRRHKEDRRDGLVIMLSAPGAEDVAFAAMREGAFDVLPTPIRADEAALTIQRAAEHERLLCELKTLRASLGTHALNGEIVAESRVMRGVLDFAATVAPQDVAVLITGEAGTGKEILARAIHRLSRRNQGPFVGVSCEAIPEHMLVNQFFGPRENGSVGPGESPGVFAQAAGGTLLVEEIAALPPQLQDQVLHAIETGKIQRPGDGAPLPVDARVIATSTNPLAPEVERGGFAEALFQRLSLAHITIPPLRERHEDIPGLLAHFAQRAAQTSGRPVSITPQALSLLTGYPWPGNVRELKNEVERAAALSATGRLDRGDFALTGAGLDAPGNNAGDGGAAGSQNLKLKPQLESFERNAIRRALSAASGNRREAAQLLGVSLRTLFYKLRRYGLE